MYESLTRRNTKEMNIKQLTTRRSSDCFGKSYQRRHLFKIIILFGLVPSTILLLIFNNNDWNHSNGILTTRSSDKDKIREILIHAGIEITQELDEKLPKWEHVASIYGTKPNIIGLETCDVFQKNTDVADAFIGPAGMYNTGTNLMAVLLNQYCTMPKRRKEYPQHTISDDGELKTGAEQSQRSLSDTQLEKEREHQEKLERQHEREERTGMLYQVPWDKHYPQKSFRLKYVGREGNVSVNQTNVLPIVMVKDPYFWIQSLCEHPYGARWIHSNDHCPNLIPNEVDKGLLAKEQQYGKETTKKVSSLDPIQVKIQYQYQQPTEYESLVGLWNGWYSEYYNPSNGDSTDNFPRLIIRYEDLLFHTEEVITNVCQCGGGIINTHGNNFMKIPRLSVKNIAHHGLADAIIRHGDANDLERLKGMTTADVEYARSALYPELMKAFGYKYPK